MALRTPLEMLADMAVKPVVQERLLKLLERHVLATERIADSLEQLLPSPFADPRLDPTRAGRKPPTPEEGGFVRFDERSLYRQQQAEKRAEMDALADELDSDSDG